MNIKLSSIRVFLPERQKPLFEVPQLEIASGTRLLIQGASGKGKTTLLHLIAGLFPPTDGYVFLGEQNSRFLSDDQLCRLRRENFGIIFQRLNLIDHLTALENVCLTLPRSLSKRTALEKALAALKRVGIDPLRDVRTANLSLGEQQRVAVARVLAAEPKVILADEPTSSLDAANAQLVMEGLLAVPGNPTLITVSHDERLRPYFSQTKNFEEWIPE